MSILQVWRSPNLGVVISLNLIKHQKLFECVFDNISKRIIVRKNNEQSLFNQWRLDVLVVPSLRNTLQSNPSCGSSNSYLVEFAQCRDEVCPFTGILKVFEGFVNCCHIVPVLRVAEQLHFLCIHSPGW